MAELREAEQVRVIFPASWGSTRYPQPFRATMDAGNIFDVSTGETARLPFQSNSPGNRCCHSVCSLRCWSISRAFIQIFSRETPSDSRKCSHTSSFLTTFRAAIRSVSINCASFMAYGNTKIADFSQSFLRPPSRCAVQLRIFICSPMEIYRVIVRPKSP